MKKPRPEIEDLLALIDNLCSGIIVMQNMKFIYANKKMQEILEESAETLQTKSIPDYFFDEMRQIIKGVLDDISKSGGQHTGIYSIKLQNNKRKVVEIITTLMNKEAEVIMMEIKDITHVEEERKNINSYAGKLEKAIDEAPLAIIIFDKEGKIVYVNNVFGLLKLMKKESVLGRNIRDFANMKNRDEIFNKLYYAFENRIDMDETFYVSNERLSNFWFRMNIKQLYKDSEYEGFIVMINDIGELKRLQTKIEKLNLELNEIIRRKDNELEIKTRKFERNYQAMRYLLEDVHAIQKELEKANKDLETLNKDLESFNYSVSHDLKAPLRAIKHYSEFLREDLSGKLTKEQNNMLDEIIKQGEKMNELLKDLLNFSRYGKVQLDYTDIDMKELFSAIVSETLRNVKNPEKYKIKIADLPTLRADYSMMKQVVVNLISNAVKFSALRQNPEIEVGFVASEGKIDIFVKDNGIGFGSPKSQIIFEPFTRLANHSNIEGTGVGLAIVKRIIEKHGGSVYAEGEFDKGAKVGFILN